MDSLQDEHDRNELGIAEIERLESRLRQVREELTNKDHTTQRRINDALLIIGDD